MKLESLARPGPALALALSLCAPALTAAPAPTAPAPTAPAPSASADPYQPLEFLVGHCWKGIFPKSTQTDEHCFSRVYGGKFLRDEHVVHRDGAPDEFGETLYVWNSAAGQLEYLYIESGGGFIHGTVGTDGQTLVFPAAPYVDGGKSMNVRSRWRRSGEASYEVATEFEIGGRWVAAFSLPMQRE